ncbi:uncharacterized protein TNCV_2833921 [Trichonephila clavipes]|nr:uncharacterized protein TNCV_2833921 [Trichonephila clavipes]
MKWAGHVVREWMKTFTTKKVFNAQPIGTRKKGRLNLRWTDGLEKDLLALRTKTWRRLTCKRLLENVNTLLGCRDTEEERKDSLKKIT